MVLRNRYEKTASHHLFGSSPVVFFSVVFFSAGFFSAGFFCAVFFRRFYHQISYPNFSSEQLVQRPGISVYFS